jgi:hypothetical protein
MLWLHRREATNVSFGRGGCVESDTLIPAEGVARETYIRARAPTLEPDGDVRLSILLLESVGWILAYSF